MKRSRIYSILINVRQQLYLNPLDVWIRLGACSGWTMFLAWFFYRKCWMAILLLPVWLSLLNMEVQDLRRKKQFEMETLFQEFLVSLSAGLRAGYSLPNAFEGALRELILLHGEKNLLTKELKRVNRAIRDGEKVERMISDIGRGLDCKAMEELGEVLEIATGTGGNLPKIMNETSGLLNDRYRLRQEIEDGLAGRRFEAKIMECMPFLLVLYVEIGSPGFFEVLFGNAYGMAIMTLCLFAYVGAKIWMFRIIGQATEV